MELISLFFLFLEKMFKSLDIDKEKKNKMKWHSPVFLNFI